MGRIRAVLASGMLLVSIGSAPASAGIAYPAPDPLPPAGPATLVDRYEANRTAVREALVVARAVDDNARATILDSLTGRDLLEFDARGNGRAVEVISDLVAADRIAVIVPGAHTTLDNFDGSRAPGGGARALAAEIEATGTGDRVAVVAWLGYDTPQGISPQAATDSLARAGAPALRTTVDELRAVNPDAPIALFCHSYGSVVCAYAAPEVTVTDLVFYGSPGVGAGTTADLDTPARVWAGRSSGDWIRFVPSVRLVGIGFGTDPTAPEFGALLFPAGDGGHGDYHLRGGPALHSLALIALGRMEMADA